MVEMIYPGITVETCRNACRDVYSYQISDNLRNTSSLVEFWRGSREVYPEKSVALLKKIASRHDGTSVPPNGALSVPPRAPGGICYIDGSNDEEIALRKERKKL